MSNTFGTGSGFAAPAPPSSGVNYADLNGRLLLIQVLGVEQGVQTVHGLSNPVRATITVLDGPSAEEVHEDTLVFPKVLQSQLKGKVGQMVLGRLGQGNAKPGQSAPWMLNAATAEDVQVADAYVRKAAQPTIHSAEAPF